MAGAGRDERAWVRGAQGGSASDFEALFRAHWPRAYRAAYLVVHDAAGAEDVAQEAFIAAVRALDRFDSRAARSAPGCTGSSSTARSTGPGRGRCGARWAPERRSPTWPPRSGPIPPPRSRRTSSPRSPSLSPDHRAVIVLRYVLEYTPGEIARMLELPRGTVNSRLRRGLDALQGAVDEEEER